MKHYLLNLRSLTLLAMLTMFSVITLAQDNVKTESFKINFATLSQAQEIISKGDDFISNLNQLDIDARLGKTGGTLDELIEKQKASCREFTDEEKAIITKGINRIEKYLIESNSTLAKPQGAITFVKTTMEEELDAGAYTRGTTIYLGESMFGMSDSVQMFYLAHELCHVLTRNNRTLRESLYNAIGFEPLYGIEIPEDLADRWISNPDVSKLSAYADFTINGKTVPCAMFIYVDDSYKVDDSIFESMKIGLIALDEFKEPLIVDGKTVVYSIDDATDFYAKVGRNTNYVIDPEECVADNFAFVVNGNEDKPNPEILQRIKLALGQKNIDMKPESMTIFSSYSTLFTGRSYSLDVMFTPAGANTPLEYKNSNPDVLDLKFNQETLKGTIFLKKAGTSVVTFWCKNYPEITASKTFTVIDPNIIVEKDFTSEDISTASLAWNDTEQLTQFIKQYCGVNMPEDYTFVCTPSNPDIMGFRHYECKQMNGNEKISDSEVVVHTDANGKMMFMTGQVYSQLAQTPTPDNKPTGSDDNSSAKKSAQAWGKKLVNKAAQPRKAAVGTEEVQLQPDTYYYGKDHLKVSECIGSKDSEGNYILQVPGKLYTLNFTNNIVQGNGFDDAENFANINEMLAAGENFTSTTPDFSALSDGMKSNLTAVIAMLPKSFTADATYSLEVKKCKYADIDVKYVAPADTVGKYSKKKGLDASVMNKYLLPAINKGTQMGKATGVADPEMGGMRMFSFDDVQFSTPYREKDADNEVENHFYALVMTCGADTVAYSSYPLKHCDQQMLMPCTNGTENVQLMTQHTLVTCQPAINIHWSLQRTLDCFRQRFGIDSFDGKGTPLVAMVNYTDEENTLPSNATACPEVPADGSCGVMWFGMGQFNPNVDKDLKLYNHGLYPLCMMAATAHEYTHLVAHKLGGSDDASALNESYADIMGKMVERMSLNQHTYASGDDTVEFVSWKLGQESGYGTPQFVARRFDDPHLNEHPKFYHGKYWQPNGDMHVNAGVQNYWFYLLCNGGTVTPEKGESVTINAIDRDKAELIAFSALNYFGMCLLDYPLARKHSIYATRMYYGDDSDELKAVYNAWYAVGVGQDEWQPGMPTSINAINNTNNSTPCTRKMMKGGKIVIMKDGIEYNVFGQRL